jgi:hypothetical protein
VIRKRDGDGPRDIEGEIVAFWRIIATLIALAIVGGVAWLIDHYLIGMLFHCECSREASTECTAFRRDQAIFAVLAATGAIGGLILPLYDAATAPNAADVPVSAIRQIDWVRVEPDGIHLGFVGNMLGGAALASAAYFLLGTSLGIEANAAIDTTPRGFFGLVFIGLGAGVSADILFRNIRGRMAELLTRQRELELKQNLLEDGLKINQYYSDATASLGKEKFDDAEALFKKALDVDKRHTSSLMGLAQVNEMRARDMLKEPESKAPDEATKDKAAAEKLLDDAIEIMGAVIKGTRDDPFLSREPHDIKKRLGGRHEYVVELEDLRGKSDASRMQELLTNICEEHPDIAKTIADKAKNGEAYKRFRGEPWFKDLTKTA